MLKLVDCKGFTDESTRRITKNDDVHREEKPRKTYAMELKVACTPVKEYTAPGASSFRALLDTGFSGEVLISHLHYTELSGAAPESFATLPLLTKPLRLVGGVAIEGVRRWNNGKVWLFPGGRNEGTGQPILIPQGYGILVLPPPTDDPPPSQEGLPSQRRRRYHDAYIGLVALRRIRAHVDIDLEKHAFSIRVPAEVV